MPPPPAPRRLVTRSSARNPLHATRSTQPTPRAKTALPAHDSPPTPALVRKTDFPAHDSLRHQQLVRKTALPAHDRPPAPALVRKTALPAHDRPPTPALVRKTALLTIVSDTSIGALKRPSLLTIDPPTPAASAISKMQPSVRVCEHNHGSQLILHEYIKRTSSHPNRIGGRAFY